MTQYCKVGFHGGLGGNHTGIGEFMRRLDGAGIPFCLKSVNNVGLAVEAAGYARASGVDHVIVLRWTNPGTPPGPEVPDYRKSPEDAAREHWSLVQQSLAAAPEFEEFRDFIWLETINEPWTAPSEGQTAGDGLHPCDWLGWFAYHFAQLITGAGYRWAAFGMNSGTPEPEDWKRPGMVQFLTYCADLSGHVAVALHEYQFDLAQPMPAAYPYHIGRFERLFQACDELGILRPTTLITETGWAYNDMPDVPRAMGDIEWFSELLAGYPNVLGASLWTLEGPTGLPNKLQQLMVPLGDFILNTQYPDPEPDPQPIPDPDLPARGAPRIQYRRQYVLLPPTAGVDWVVAAAKGSYGRDNPPRHTIGGSADDSAVGDLDARIIIAVNPAEWGSGEDGTGLKGFFEKYYGLGQVSSLEYQELVVKTPEELEQVLAGEGRAPPTPITDGFDAPIGTAEERVSGTLWPGEWIDANPYGNYYRNSSTGRESYHTGADLNLNVPYWDADRGKPVYAAANGSVVAAGSYPIWGNVIVLEHPLPDGRNVYTRYGHDGQILCRVGEWVNRGHQIGTVGRDALGGPYHLHFDVSETDVLLRNPTDWPGADLQRLQQDYTDPLAFIAANRPDSTDPVVDYVEPAIGMHNEDGADWMLANGLTGWSVHSVALGPNATTFDFTRFAQAGINMLVRLNWSYSPNGTIPDPDNASDVDRFVNVCIQTIAQSKGVAGYIIANEGNNPVEFPNGRAFSPNEYAAIYNRIWQGRPANGPVGPMPIDPYYGPNSDNRVWWKEMLAAIDGADFLAIHPKTQDSNPDNVDSDAKFSNEPLTWQYLHLRSYQPLLAAVPDRFRDLPVYATEVNPQRKLDGSTLGWEMSTGAEWVRRAMAHFRNWNQQGQQQVHAAIFYRYSGDDWLLLDKPSILDEITASEP